MSKDTDTPSEYTPAELAEFKVLLDAKLAEAKADLDLLNSALEHMVNDAKGDDFAVEQLSREETQQLKLRQEKFIGHLEAAQQRMKNGTYGICRVTGKLIPKERLRLVPHATLSIPAMNNK